MRKTTLWASAVAALALLGSGIGVAAAAQDLPIAAESRSAAFDPLLPLIGKTWRGRGIGAQGVEDVVRWEWAVGGRAVRTVHAVAGGVYGGETLIFPDRDTGQLIFHYFTSGGFHTTGVIRETAPGVLEISETVHGLDAVEQLRSTLEIEGDVYRTRTQVERDGGRADFGGFDYRAEAAASGPPDWWDAHVAHLTEGGGRWVTPNASAGDDPQQPSAFALEWRAIHDGKVLSGRLFGLDEAGREIAEYWTFREYHHPGRGAVVVEQWGPGGIYGEGETVSTEPGRRRTTQTFWMPDGRSWREGHVTLEQGDVQTSEVFDIDAAGAWTSRMSNTWRRAAS
ncbi:hypothetical protein Q0812_01420 [Brevundimonas sp. 2R-24]|uniref:DUF1579 domain-containing protein n=1 Tax=Peiella sedimenti TaxID=3061083 RepID=A0ABT8SHP1_9CAUL|nr:hypothetical protein [Caulobacteraceae bacterium XZ-24]